MVYLIGAYYDGKLIAVKIGKANDVKKRLDSLRGSSPLDMEILGTLPGGRKEERWLHHRFRESKIRLEWFSPDEKIIAKFKSEKPPVTKDPDKNHKQQPGYSKTEDRWKMTTVADRIAREVMMVGIHGRGRHA